MVGDIAKAGVLMSLQSIFPSIIRDWIIGGSAFSVYKAIVKERDRGEKVRIDPG